MAKVVVKIPHVAWRDGRPRFVPGKTLRAMGYKGEDLKHPSGQFYTLSEAAKWSEDFCQNLLDRRAAKASGKKPRRPKNSLPSAYCFGQLMADWLIMLTTQRLGQGKRGQKSLSDKTITFYQFNANKLSEYDAELWASPAAAISRPVAYGIYEALRDDVGLHNTRAMIATARSAYSWGVKKGLVPQNPFRELGMQTPDPRQRVGTIPEMVNLIAAADAIGRPEVGDCIMLGLLTGQRQGDRLQLAGGNQVDGRINLQQSKTRAIVSIPAMAQLKQRIEAARERRKHLSVDYPHLIIDEVAGRPFAPSGDHYRKQFTRARKAAIEGIKAPDGSWVLEPTPELEGFRDQDLRDTAVTWLANAGCTVPEISSITGHNEVSIYQILKHYLARSPEQADAAMAKMQSWLSAKNEGL